MTVYEMATIPHRRRRVALIQSWWEDRVLRGVGNYAREHGWVLDCSMRWTHRATSSGAGPTDGIIAYSGMTKANPEIVNFLRNAGVPIVETQNVSELKNTARVVIPRKAVGALAAKHLHALGFRHFGFVTFEENIIEREPREGFSRAVAGAGGTFYPLDFANLPTALRRLPKPLGLMAANDVNALELIHACAEWGFAVPEDVAVVGVDDTEILCELAPIPLTSVNCNYERQGYEAAALLDRLMNGAAPPRRPVRIPPRGVTVRRSTDTIAIPDRESARFLRHLRDHYRELPSVEEIARGLHMSLRRVQGHFRRHVGRTPIQELNRLRVEHARQLLRDSDLKLEAVAQESGFANRFHFIRAFQRDMGVTPRDYRSATLREREN